MNGKHPLPQPLDHFDPDPVRQFHCWLEEVMQIGVAQPYAMTLATASGDNIPSARIVLLKGGG